MNDALALPGLAFAVAVFVVSFTATAKRPNISFGKLYARGQRGIRSRINFRNMGLSCAVSAFALTGLTPFLGGLRPNTGLIALAELR